jgi:predicted aminopeptidase
MGVLAAYNARVAAFESLFEREGRDFRRFYPAVERLARLPADQRQAALDALDPASAVQAEVQR